MITHGDELTLGSTTLHLHIHPGSQTCDSCEPGQVQAHAQQGPSFDQDDEGNFWRSIMFWCFMQYCSSPFLHDVDVSK